VDLMPTWHNVHALRNVTGKLPERHRELKARWWQVLDDATSAADAHRGPQAIMADYRAAYPSAMAVITDNLDALAAHLRWPSEHRKRIRSTDESVKGLASSRGLGRLEFPRFCGVLSTCDASVAGRMDGNAEDETAVPGSVPARGGRVAQVGAVDP
jgi:hypothetical protein